MLTAAPSAGLLLDVFGEEDVHQLVHELLRLSAVKQDSIALPWEPEHP